MEDAEPLRLIWWITVVDLPAMAGLLALIWRTRRDCEGAHARAAKTLSTRTEQMRDGLNAHKLEVAKSYASVRDMNALEKRLVSHLERIEAKLDATALKTEALRGEAYR